jgi:4-hydroxyphenylacetate 3-monooxygenase
VRDVYVHVDREVKNGLIVSGAKVVATGSALTNYNFVAHYGAAPIRTKEFALIFVVDMSAPGVKLISRPSYELAAEVMGSPFDYPLSSRLDENDSILMFEEVLTPWENVFVYGDIDKINERGDAAAVGLVGPRRARRARPGCRAGAGRVADGRGDGRRRRDLRVSR